MSHDVSEVRSFRLICGPGAPTATPKEYCNTMSSKSMQSWSSEEYLDLTSFKGSIPEIKGEELKSSTTVIITRVVRIVPPIFLVEELIKVIRFLNKNYSYRGTSYMAAHPMSVHRRIIEQQRATF